MHFHVPNFRFSFAGDLVERKFSGVLFTPLDHFSIGEHTFFFDRTILYTLKLFFDRVCEQMDITEEHKQEAEKRMDKRFEACREELKSLMEKS